MLEEGAGDLLEIASVVDEVSTGGIRKIRLTFLKVHSHLGGKLGVAVVLNPLCNRKTQEVRDVASKRFKNVLLTFSTGSNPDRANSSLSWMRVIKFSGEFTRAEVNKPKNEVRAGKTVGGKEERGKKRKTIDQRHRIDSEVERGFTLSRQGIHQKLESKVVRVNPG